jgi:hypothetical protein
MQHANSDRAKRFQPPSPERRFIPERAAEAAQAAGTSQSEILDSMLDMLVVRLKGRRQGASPLD